MTTPVAVEFPLSSSHTLPLSTKTLVDCMSMVPGSRILCICLPTIILLRKAGRILLWCTDRCVSDASGDTTNLATSSEPGFPIQ